MLIKLWEFRRSLGYKAIIGQIRQQVSMFGVFMQRWKLKEIMIKLDHNKVRIGESIKSAADELAETNKKIQKTEQELQKAYKVIEAYTARLKHLE